MGSVCWSSLKTSSSKTSGKERLYSHQEQNEINQDDTLTWNLTLVDPGCMFQVHPLLATGHNAIFLTIQAERESAKESSKNQIVWTNQPGTAVVKPW